MTIGHSVQLLCIKTQSSGDFRNGILLFRVRFAARVSELQHPARRQQVKRSVHWHISLRHRTVSLEQTRSWLAEDEILYGKLQLWLVRDASEREGVGHVGWSERAEEKREEEEGETGTEAVTTWAPCGVITRTCISPTVSLPCSQTLLRIVVRVTTKTWPARLAHISLTAHKPTLYPVTVVLLPAVAVSALVVSRRLLNVAVVVVECLNARCPPVVTFIFSPYIYLTVFSAGWWFYQIKAPSKARFFKRTF